jgi:hypothetical protein
MRATAVFMRPDRRKNLKMLLYVNALKADYVPTYCACEQTLYYGRVAR